MNERGVTPTPDILSRQGEAGHPQHSVWVSANAGSGKTHILSERVLRLLLGGVAPQNILCLTYTKAAAAQMQSRVAARLSGWALRDDDVLRADLRNLSGYPPDGEILARARTLFAQALETPGGLKINTIHAFCEAVLHRFPFEAGVPVDFSVIEEAEKGEMIENARDAVLAKGLSGDGQVADAVAILFRLLSDDGIEKAVAGALGSARELRQVLADPGGAKNNLRQLLGVSKLRPVAEIEEDGLRGCIFSPALAKRLLALTPPDPAKNRFENKLARLDWSRLTLEALFETFLVKAGTVPKTGFPKKSVRDKDCDLGETMLAEAQRLEQVFAQLKKAALIERSEALVDVMAAIKQRYQQAKQRQSRLDFDDLITRLALLLSLKDSAQWVRYKLDAGITHILVDESQDTNPDQWNVVRVLVDDFYDGDSAHERARTLFGVGDEKQSIYSFQGADPALFGETGRELALRAMSAKKPWKNIRFRASFRTLENILKAVDLVCERSDIRAALLSTDAPVGHESARTDKGGSITLWPPVQVPKDENPDNKWPTSLPVQLKTAPRLLAERIAAQIRHWIVKKRPLAARGRVVSADDILILVQSRGPLFKEIIRALKQAGLPTPGADKLPVTDHIVVRDLLVLGEVLLNPNDDLALATLLRSPLFGISETELEALCAKRRPGISVWRSINSMARTHDWAAKPLKKLQDWRQKLEFDRPYEFFASVLFARGGLKDFHARLGSEIDDVISEFLDLALAHELEDQPSLQGFLADLRQRDISITRELSRAGSGVRVMSVHGAKGLEAPIVILADATAVSTKTGPVYLQGEPGPVLVHASSMGDHTVESDEYLRQPELEKQMAEYWRKLYVAMTRAEDELYVTGVLPAARKNPGDCWYEAIKGALDGLFIEVSVLGEDGAGLRYPVLLPEPKPVTGAIFGPDITDDGPLPGPLAKPLQIETIRPSNLAKDKSDPLLSLATSAERALGASDARRRGIALHALLQHLAPLTPEQRLSTAKKALAVLLPASPELHDGLTDKAPNILSGKDAKALFGANSRAELPIFVNGTMGGRAIRIIARIDRIVVDDDRVLVVDFKSDAQPARQPGEINPGYLSQLGLYLRACEKLFPAQRVEAAIYWTGTERLMRLPNEKLYRATQKFKFC